VLAVFSSPSEYHSEFSGAEAYCIHNFMWQSGFSSVWPLEAPFLETTHRVIIDDDFDLFIPQFTEVLSNPLPWMSTKGRAVGRRLTSAH
jgi:hypothetical protein